MRARDERRGLSHRGRLCHPAASRQRMPGSREKPLEATLRDMKTLDHTPRILALAFILWSGAVAAASWEGVFAKLSPGTFVALCVFAVAYAVSSYGLDAGLRWRAAALGARRLWAAALASDALLAATGIAMASADGAWLANLARFPFAWSALFVAPLAAALHAAAFACGARAWRLRSGASARSPGANPAGT
jgi:hypothetical protein